jgi:Protein of unknown function (DUF2975)
VKALSKPSSEATRTNWLGRTRGAAVFIQWASLSLAVAVVVIGIAPKSPVLLDVSVARLANFDRIGGVASNVRIDQAGRLALRLIDASFSVRMLNLGTTVPGLVLIAEIARRMAKLLRRAERNDPFTDETSRELSRVAIVAAVGGIAVWAIASVVRWQLSSYVLTSGRDASLLEGSPVGWLGTGLIIAAFGQVVRRGVAMRTELDAVI